MYKNGQTLELNTRRCNHRHSMAQVGSVLQATSLKAMYKVWPIKNIVSRKYKHLLMVQQSTNQLVI